MSDATGKTVLIVDDDPDFLLQQKVQFEAAGYKPLTASTKDEALKLLENHCPAVAVVDLMMEEEDTGFVLCYQIKKQNPDVLVIMVTGVASETGIEFDAATEEERAWVKADALLPKPVRFEQLLGEIERHPQARE
jgi:two-component system, OmpR family, response regulator